MSGTKQLEFAIPPRLKRCLEAGSVEALFPILKDWDHAELQALVQEADEFHDVQVKRLSKEYETEAWKTENFFNPYRVKALDDAFKGKQIALLGTLSGISSVALYYLESAPPAAPAESE